MKRVTCKPFVSTGAADVVKILLDSSRRQTMTSEKWTVLNGKNVMMLQHMKKSTVEMSNCQTAETCQTSIVATRHNIQMHGVMCDV